VSRGRHSGDDGGAWHTSRAPSRAASRGPSRSGSCAPSRGVSDDDDTPRDRRHYSKSGVCANGECGRELPSRPVKCHECFTGSASDPVYCNSVCKESDESHHLRADPVSGKAVCLGTRCGW
jgi:hypothetical protein